MNIFETINQDLKKAMIEKNEMLTLVLRGIISSVRNKEIEKRTKLSKSESDPVKLEQVSKLTDEEIIDVISGEAKKRKDSIVEFGKGGRQDLVDKETKELEILKKYLPEQLSDDVLREIIKKAVEETGASGPKDTGKVMAKIMPQVKGRADGTTVSKIVGEFLKA